MTPHSTPPLESGRPMRPLRRAAGFTYLYVGVPVVLAAFIVLAVKS